MRTPSVTARSRIVWLLWATALTTVLAGLATVVWNQAASLVALSFLVMGPLFAALRSSVRQTILVGIYACALAVLIIVSRTHDPWSFTNLMRLWLIVLASIFAVWTASVRTARETAAALVRAVFDSAPMGLAVYDDDGTVVQANQYLTEQHGQAIEDLLRISAAEIAISDQGQRAMNCFQHVLKHGTAVLDQQFSRTNPANAAEQQLLVSFFPVRDRTGAILGVGLATVDTTERMQAEAALRKQDAIQLASLDSALDCIITIDADGRVVEFNRAAETTFGYQRQEVIGKVMTELIIPEHLRQTPHEGIARYLETEGEQVLGQRLVMEALDHNGREFPVELSISRLPGEPVLFTAYLRDISDRQAADAEARMAAKRARFIADASAILNRNLDYRQTLSEVAHLIVPQLADWCMVHIIEDKRLERLTIAHIDHERQLQAETIAATDAVQSLEPFLSYEQPQLWHEVRRSDLRALFSNEKLIDNILDLELASVLVVPLIAKGSCLGFITLATDTLDRHFDDRDRVLAEDLAARAASAIMNARLYDERAQIAQALQRSLLPPSLPRLPGLEIAARYQAVGEGAEVGGDFYDAFPTGDDSWIVLVGDVEGKGPEAAALVALVHYSLRTIALQEQSPAEMLARLNEAILAQRDDGRFCTLALAQLQLQPDRSLSGWLALGGHPFPLVKRANGLVERVGTPGMIVGITADFHIENTRLTLQPGEMMLLYSDGISEARHDGVMLGDHGVMKLLSESSATEPDDVVQMLQDAAVRWQDNELLDDLALLAIRVPERQPVSWRKRFSARPESVAEIRRGLETALSQRSDVSTATLNLLASELAANAILYGQHELSGETIMIEVRLAANETRLRCEVINRGVPFLEDPSDPGVDAEGGRGLFLVEQLSDRWGKDATVAGRTRVWFEVNIPLPEELDDLLDQS
jgi:PAS domain S-box-containing protein